MTQRFIEKLATGEVLVSDGATGTGLQRMGLPLGAAGEVWVLENPEAIRALAMDFKEAGADILLTSTFGGTRFRLKDSNLVDEFITINRKAIEITKDVVSGSDVLVGGSIGPTGQMLAPLGTLSVEEAEAEFAAEARLMSEGGVDVIVIETMFDLNEAIAAVQGVRSVDQEIPLVCSFSFDRGTRTMMGVSPEDVAAKIGVLDVDLLGINCGRSLVENLEVLKRLRQVTDKLIWFKPNAGLPEIDDEGHPYYSISAKEMGEWVPQWINAGAQIVGGCCGTSPEHLAEIANAVHARRDS
ncbi:MAG: homocysteine S-methyltransferase family protein [Chloroflexota bacterium]|nr:homocysteine S-methyltransferase family protein [Chloroflexota bacterium]